MAVVLCTLFICTLPHLPNKLLNNPHLCACKQATGGSISRFFERTEESFGGFQFMAEEARGGAVFLVGVVTLGGEEFVFVLFVILFLKKI